MMTNENVEDFDFQQISKAIVATANSHSSMASGSSESNSGEGGLFDVVRRKWEKVQDAFQVLASPLKRHSMYEELPEHVWPQDHIEMSRLIQHDLGHVFLPCHLTNPTWCDYCGDFIWGVYKQCLRCQTCQYTCHEHCVSAVTLSCKSISGDGCDAIGARTASPSAPRSLVETSLLIGNIHARPGRIVPNIGNSTTETTTVGVPRVSESVPNFQYIAQEKRRGLGDINPELSYVHTDTPRPLNVSTHHRSWSISEDFATAHSYPIHHPGIVSGPAPDSSYVQLTSSSQCLPSYSDRQVGSRQYKDSSRQPEPHSVSLRPESDTVGGVVESTNVTQHVSVDNSAVEFPKDNSHLHFPDVHRPDEETNPEATTEKDETDSGYRSGTMPDDKLPRVPSQETLDQQELQRKVAKYNHFVPAACLGVVSVDNFYY